MKAKDCLALVLAAALVMLTGGGAMGASTNRPFLFLTASDVARAREGVKTSSDFAQMAAELTQRAGSAKIEALPVLDSNWWYALTNKAWRDCYPENHHHTLALPIQWASLARDCARASLVTNSPALALKGREVLLKLSDYSFAWDHFDTGMFYTLWGAQALEAYDVLYDHFTAGERARLDAFFDRYLGAVQRNDEYWVKNEPGGILNNHYAWHKLGLMMIGLFYGRSELVEQALRGPKGVDHMMRSGFKDDGLWLEGAIPYQLTTTVPLVVMAEMLENSGHQEGLWRRPLADGPGLKQTYDALLTLLFPDGTLPPLGDAYARRTHLGDCADLEILTRRFSDPAGAWLLRSRPTRPAQALFNGLPELPAGAVPVQTSRLWPEMGYAALRSREGRGYWAGRSWTAFATFSAMPVHQHADKLSLMLFGGGHLWLPDCEAKSSAEHAFSSAVQTQLNRQTVCHNTLLVDGRGQRHPSERLDLVEFDVHSSIKRLTMADTSGRLYPGVAQMRTIIVREDYVLDFYQVRSDRPRDYAWMTHVDGQPAANSLTNWAPATFPTNAPWSWLQTPRHASAADRYSETFLHDTGTLRLDLATDGPVEVIQCGFPKEDTARASILPMRLVQCRRAEAWFLAIYRLTSTSQAIELRVAEDGPLARKIEVSAGGKATGHTVPRLSAEPPGRSQSAAVEHRAKTLQAMTDVMGPAPLTQDSRTPAIQVLGEEPCPKFTRRTLVFASPDGDHVPALLLLPSPVRGKAPAVLCLHQTTPLGKGEPAGLGGSTNLHYARELAERGFVTLAPDYPNFGDYRADPYALGYASASMKGIVNHRAALQVLSSLPEVDADRIGVIGHSLGGHNAMFLAAFDPRVKAVVTSCGFNSFFKYKGGDLTGWSHAGYMPRITTAYGCDPKRMPFDFTDVLASLAPRPIFINAPLHDDNFELSGVQDCVAAAKPVYDLSKAPTNLELATPDCGHDFPPAIRRRAYEWLGQHLKVTRPEH